MAGPFDDLTLLTQGEAARRRKAVADALARGGVGPAAGVAVREGAKATGGALAATGEMIAAPARAVGQELAGFYRALATGEPTAAAPAIMPAAPVAPAPAPAPAVPAAPVTAVAPGAAPFVPDVRRLETPQYISAAGQPTTDWTKTAAYAEGVRRAEKEQVEAALLDIGEAARTQSGAAGERERAAAIARTRLRLDPTGGAAARRAEVATGVTEQQMAQAARLNQLQAQYLAESDPTKQAQIGAMLMTLAGKAQPEEFKLEAIQQGEILGGPENMPVPLKQAALPVLVGSRGTVRTVPTGAGTGAPRGINAPPKDLKDFLAKARPVNPGMSDAELTAQYDRLYGKK